MTNFVYGFASALVLVAICYLLRNVFKRIGKAFLYVVNPKKYDIVKKEVPGALKFAPLAGLAGGLSFKVISYIIIFAIVGTVCFALYKKITATTYSSDYKNQISHNQDVIIDQRAAGNGGCSVELAYGLVKIGCKQLPVTKVVNNGVATVTNPVPAPVVAKKTSILKKVWSVVVKPVNAIKKVVGIK